MLVVKLLVESIFVVVLTKTPAAPSVVKLKFPIDVADNTGVSIFTNGSTIVIFPSVKFKFEVSNLNEVPPKATEVAASPLLLLSTIISPPV